jgi:uncharacterized membrane-anchored protein YitT (DUF2179 family)
MNFYFGMRKTELIKCFFMIIIGSFLCAISLNLFIIPSNLLSGGVSGIALIIQYLTEFPVGITVLILNIPLFILSILKINKKFTIFTGIGLISLSIGLIITTPLNNVLSPVAESSKLLYCIYGGVLNGLGLGIVFTNYGSTGGLDIISMYMKKKYDINLGSVSFTINFIIISIGSILFEFTIGLYTLVSIYVTSISMEKVIKGFNTQKMLLIITSKQKEVSSAVMDELNRGITVLYGEGAYSHEKKNVLYCVVSLPQLPKIKHIVRSIDENAFLSILDTSEVQGKGFKNPLA